MTNQLLRDVWIVVAILLVAVSSTCKHKKDTPNPVDYTGGTWQLVALTYDGYYQTDDGLLPAIGKGKTMDNVLVTLDSNGRITGNGRTFILDWTEKATGTRIAEFEIVLFATGGTWRRQSNVLTMVDFVDSGDEVNLTIADLTTEQMCLKASLMGSEDSGRQTRMEMRFARVK